jgi:hypothetical protein
MNCDFRKIVVISFLMDQGEFTMNYISTEYSLVPGLFFTVEGEKELDQKGPIADLPCQPQMLSNPKSENID